MATTEKTQVVVVGGGAAGLAILRRLGAKLDMEKHELVLVTATPYYTHLPACIRMVVTSAGSLEDSAFVPYDTILQNLRGVKVVVGTVVRIEEDTPERWDPAEVMGSGKLPVGSKGRVVLEGKDEGVRYDVLVLATGSRWEGPLNFPGSREEVKVWVEEWREKFAKAEDVVIIGGGPTGVEFAGEIRDLSKTKRITIVHDQPLLLSDAYPDGFRKTVAKNLRRRDITVVLGDSVPNDEISDGRTITTQKGLSLAADLVIPCRGPSPKTEFLSGLSEGVTSDAGYVKVKTTLQLKFHPRIFAAGDIIDWDEQKQAIKYAAHAKVVAANVISVLKDKQPNALYRGCYERTTIANGKRGGTTHYSYWGPHLKLGNLPSSVAKARVLKAPLKPKRLLG